MLTTILSTNSVQRLKITHELEYNVYGMWGVKRGGYDHKHTVPAADRDTICSTLPMLLATMHRYTPKSVVVGVT